MPHNVKSKNKVTYITKLDDLPLNKLETKERRKWLL